MLAGGVCWDSIEVVMHKVVVREMCELTMVRGKLGRERGGRERERKREGEGGEAVI